MKLRAVELTDIRRFANQTVRVGEIGEGVSVLSAPNESGKSTLFDALHALLFHPHSGKPKDVVSLRPHAGGAPTVEAEVEIDGRRHRIRKRWLSRPEARVLGPDGVLIAQADQAEAWIARHLSGPLGGPSGLLWIRQGRAEFGPRDDPGARRDILGQVAGEIDAMTGGRRMDAVMARVAAALEPMLTPTGRPRGPLLDAQREVERLDADEATLAAKVAALSQALADRQRAQRRRAELDDPAAEAERAERLKRAEAEADALRRHGEQRDKAGLSMQLAEAELTAATEARDRLRALADDVAAADLACRQAEAAVADLAAQAASAHRTAAAARNRAEGAKAALSALTRRQTEALRRQQARAAAQQVADLSERLSQVELALARATEAEAARSTIPVTPDRLDRARRAEADLAAQTLRAEARAVTLRFAYTGPQRALREGQPVEGPVRLTGPARFDLPGLGQLTVEPGATDAAAAQLPEAQAALARALAECGADTLAQAVAALARADDLTRQAASARQTIALLAPDGVEALRTALARARALAATDSGTDEGADADALLAATAQAEQTATTTDAEARAAEAAAARADQALAGATATATAARQRRDQALARRGAEGDHARALLQADTDLHAATAALAGAQAVAQALAQTAPDADTIAARLAQARGALRQHADERAALNETLAGLRARIETLAEQGIEESLWETRDRLTAARALADARQAEVAALQRLRAALDGARASARTAYLAPVIQELAPMLALLHPGAEVALDDASLLPAGLTRGGRDEAIEILSGGTREQIAVLTRLAFARLFARTGRALPVILDDALVQTDDDRIEAMFTALHRAAQGQQVIVLTCRQRAFAALGGQRLEFRRIDG